MARTPRAWAMRAKEEEARGPFTEAEDAELINATSCGVDLHFVRIGDRTFGEIIRRRTELVEAGVVTIRPEL